MELSLSNRQIRGGGAHHAGGLTKQASLVTLVQSHPLRSQSSFHTGGQHLLLGAAPATFQVRFLSSRQEKTRFDYWQSIMPDLDPPHTGGYRILEEEKRPGTNVNFNISIISEICRKIVHRDFELD